MRAFGRCASALGICLISVSVPARSQDAATLTGRVVHKATKAGIPDVEVHLAPGNSYLATDSAGRFRFDQVTPGRVALFVRRLGFTPESVSFDVRPRDTLDVEIELAQTAQSLDTVNVAARENPIPRGKLSAFYERKQFGIGRFIEAKDIERITNRQLADVLIARLPGVRAIRGRTGGVFIATSRLIPRAFTGGGPCYAEVYLDGVIVYAFGAGMPQFDVNTIDPQHVAGIEFYSGPAQIPAQYNKTGAACGVLLIWTK